ncbi:MAG: zinc ABC transporter permease [Propionibacteriaceae bacterium]|nr:zinc ABC transporter permease [Propionibacteriaceae bacterium]
MSSVTTPARRVAPGRHQLHADGAASLWKSVRPLDAFLFSLFLFDRLPVAGVLPFGVGLSALLVFVGFLRKPLYQVRYHGLVMLLCAATVLYLGAVSWINDVDFAQRLLRIALLFALALTVMQGRFHWFSACVGLMISSILVNIPLFYAGVAPDLYHPYLTGWFYDKNVSGMWYACLAILGLFVIRRVKWQLVWSLGMMAVLFLTGSRTSMAAYLVGLAWFLLRNRLAWIVRLGLAGILIWTLDFAEERLARIGVFASRGSSDEFRLEIARLTHMKVSGSPWYGSGLSTAFVDMKDRTFWFHDSYAALRVEGGIPLVVAVAGVLFILLGLQIFSSQRKVSFRARVGEAACFVVLVCAWKLGEVFFSSVAMLVLGFTLWAHFAEPSEEVRDGLLPPELKAGLGMDQEDPLADAISTDPAPTDAVPARRAL